MPVKVILSGDNAVGLKYANVGIYTAKRLRADGHTSLSRTISLGAVTMRIVLSPYGNDKVFIEASARALDYWYTGSVALPCPGRTLSIVTSRGFMPTLVPVQTGGETVDPATHGGINSWATWRVDIVDTFGNVVGSFNSEFYYYPIHFGSKVIWVNFCEPLSYVLSYANPYPFQPWSVFSGEVHYSSTPPVDGSWSPISPSYDSLMAAGASQWATNIFLSDGTQLASFPYTVLDAEGHKANYPLYTEWSGDGWLDLYTDTLVDGSWQPVFSQRATFEAPQDVVLQEHADPTNGARPGWLAAQATALRRERARRKTCSDNLKAKLAGWAVDGVPIYQTSQWTDVQKSEAGNYIADTSGSTTLPGITVVYEFESDPNLVGWYIKTETTLLKITGEFTLAGTLTDAVRYPVKRQHLRSNNTYMPGHFSVSTVTETIADDGAGNTTVKKMVTMTYTPPPDSNGNPSQPVTQEQVGTKQTERIWYASNGVEHSAYGTRTTYTDWMDVNAEGGSTTAFPANTAKFYIDSTGDPLMQLMNGATFTSPGLYDGSGYAYIPTPPATSDTTTLTTHPFFAQFRADYKPLYGAGNTAFLDSALVDKESITIVPVSTVHATLGDLGMFPYSGDVNDATKLTFKADVKATYRYNYVDGSFTFKASKIAATPATDIAYLGAPNIVVKSSVTQTQGWKDVIGTKPAPAYNTYRYQLARFKKQAAFEADPSKPDPGLSAYELLLFRFSRMK